MKVLTLLAFIAFLLASSCVYENDETYFNPVPPPDGAEAAINLNNATDLIEINKPTMFSFQVQPSGKGSYNAAITVGDFHKELFPSTTGEFFFTIDPALTGDGTKILKIEAVYPSLSPSLAGQLGAEVMILTREWNLVIDTTPPAQLTAPLVYIEDGKSMVEWNTPTSHTFTELIILRRYLDESNSVLHTDSIKVQDRNATLFHDASYLGGKVSYRIDLKGYKYYVFGQETSFNVQPIRFSFDSLAEMPVISWKKSPLYNNDLALQMGNEFYPISSAGSFAIQGIEFGRRDFVRLSLVANHPPPSQVYSAYQKTFNLPIYRGIKIDPFNYIAFISDENSYLVIDQNLAMYKLDATTLQKISSTNLSVGGTLVVSPNGKYACLQTDRELYEIDVAGLSNRSKLDLTTLTGNSTHVFTGTASLSNTNVITFSVNYWTAPKDFAIDLTMRQVVFEKPQASFPVISPDGNYIYGTDRIYKKEGSSWITLDGLIPFSNYTPIAAFYNNNVNQLFVLTGPVKVYEVGSTPDNEGKLIPIQSLSFTRGKIDYATNTLYGLQSSQFSYFGVGYVHDLQDHMKVIRTLDIRDPEQAVFVNGHFFHRSGLYYP